MTIKEKRIVNSALWAAYGDALGFITELADEKTVRYRAKTSIISTLVPWKRKIGGMYGPTINLPTGAYSDDTQLRLATSRAINQTNYFSLNHFSKIELPTWTAYALGAGIGTKKAASSLSKRTVAWFNNFYNDENSSYITSGGNGAAMRIQPHVWATDSINIPESYLSDVIKNAITTHGHPRAIAGAVFHALCLSYVIEKNKIPSIQAAKEFNIWTLKIPSIIKKDMNLNTAWVPLFESKTHKSLEDAYQEVYDEINSLLNLVCNWELSNRPSYESLVELLDLKNKKIRGSGTLTAVAALAASHLETKSLNVLLLDVINNLSTDTDSIATMIGALRGYLEDDIPPATLQDQYYIISDAERLYRISIKTEKNNYQYPDVLLWQCPSSPLDYVVKKGEELIFPPFGVIKEISETFSSNNTKSYDYLYQWVESSFGQSFLVKRRQSNSLKFINDSITSNNNEKNKIEQIDIKQLDLLNDTKQKPKNRQKVNVTLDIDELTTLAIASNFNSSLIGEHITMLSNSTLGINGAVAYTGIIAKAIIVRQKRQY